MYVWRIPTLLFAPLVTATLLLAASAGLLACRRLVTTRVVRGLMLALVPMVLLTSPLIVSGVVELFAPSEPDVLRAYIHPSVITLWSPALIAPAVLFFAYRLFPRSSTPGAVCVRYRIRFLATVLVFAILNVANWCSPGWCERYGFPLPYSWWSDAMLIIDGKNMTAGTSIAAVVLNAGVLAVGGYAMSKAYHRHRSIA